MATKFERAFISALVAVGSLALMPATAEETQRVALLPTNDPVLDRAFNVIRESQSAQRTKVRRNEYKPSHDTKVVRSRQNPHHVYILGGAAAMPM